MDSTTRSRTVIKQLLGKAQCFTDLAAHARLHPPARLLSWLPGWDLHASGFDAAMMIAVPDGYGLWEQDGKQLPFFLEYDRGTERPFGAGR